MVLEYELDMVCKSSGKIYTLFQAGTKEPCNLHICTYIAGAAKQRLLNCSQSATYERMYVHADTYMYNVQYVYCNDRGTTLANKLNVQIQNVSAQSRTFHQWKLTLKN